MKKLAFLFVFLAASVSSKAGVNDAYISGGLYLGYTFGAGITYGYEFNAGLLRMQYKDEPVNASLTFGRYWVHVKYKRTSYTHRIKFMGVMAESNYFDLKLGWGQARNRWGRTANNRCRVGGLYYDLSFTTHDPYMPWIGIKRFDYPVAAWAWFWQPYNTVYVKYKTDLYGNSGIKNMLPQK